MVNSKHFYHSYRVATFCADREYFELDRKRKEEERKNARKTLTK
jgi:hypothetical protein